MSDRAWRVVKLGGSLLDWPELAPCLAAWLDRQPPAANVLIAGGGPLVETLRELDRAQRLGDEAMHWLAIRTMSVTATLVAGLLPQALLVKTLAELRATAAPRRPIVLDPWDFLRTEAQQLLSARLPASWDVTSDSIAARLAALLSANELVLLKSTLPEGPATRSDAALAGLVDRYFPEAARTIAHVRAVNLRAPAWTELELAAQ